MAVAKDNEKIFLNLFRTKVGNHELLEQKKYTIEDKLKRRLSSSVDYYMEHEGRQMLIEVDSYNMAKVVVGQYLLLNRFRDQTLTNPVFLVVHTYSDYKPERTIKYLQHVNEEVFMGLGIPFGVIHINSLIEWAGGGVDDFIRLFDA